MTVYVFVLILMKTQWLYTVLIQNWNAIHCWRLKYSWGVEMITGLIYILTLYRGKICLFVDDNYWNYWNVSKNYIIGRKLHY